MSKENEDVNKDVVEDDMLDNFMNNLNDTLSKEKLTRKNKLLKELAREYDKITSLANLVKPALAGLADTTSFTEAQLKSVAQYEQEWKKKKQETDNDNRDRTDERKKFVREQMKQFAKTKTSLGTSSSPRSISKKTEEEIQTKSGDESDKEVISGEPKESKDTVNTDTEEDVHPHPLLSGVAKLIEKEKKVKKRKERELVATDSDEEEGNDKPKKKKKKKKLLYDQDHQNYDSWAPPPGQTGDGRTHLNEKFGY